MFINIRDANNALSPREYGETIALLAEVEKKTNLKIIETIVLPTQNFNKYYKIRYINDDIIDSAVNLLEECGILLDGSIFTGISVYKECLVPIEYMITSNNFPSIKYAITKLYEAWFDEKPSAYRIAHKIIKEDTFPAIFIQPVVSADNFFSVVTRNSVDGAILRADNYQNIVHCKFPVFNEAISNMVNDIDHVFIGHQKIFYTYDDYGNINIIKLRKYPITKKAYFSMLVEKHKKKNISSKEFLQFIAPDDLVKFDGYTLDIPSMYKQAMGLAPGWAIGYVVFTSTDLQILRKQGNQGPYILVASEIGPEDIEILHQCSGAVFIRSDMTSHGAVICRGMGIPAIGDNRFNVDNLNRVAYALENEIHEGDCISICALSENGWGLKGEIVPTFKTQVDDELYDYVIGVLHEYNDMESFSRCDIEFQLHYAGIKEALHKLGVKYENIIH